MTSSLPKLGIIAGSGIAPKRVIEACRAQGRPFFVICLEGQADKDVAGDAPHAWLPLGAGSRLREISKAEKLEEIVMIGAVRRPSLLELKPDWLSVKIAAKIGLNSMGDDGLLRAVGKAVEEECGVRVIAAHEILGGILLKAGPLGKIAPDAQAQVDIERGITVARKLGEADVGQSVIVQQGIVLGVEAIEGTDALIARCAGYRREGPGGVLVKLAKPQQDERFDLPTIGPDTVTAAARAGLIGIAAQAGRSLLIDRDDVRKLADSAGLFVMGIDGA
ncbi:MAG: UDP-2,3-diacylglucosamine diphosphatase LpxI [Alphaproteobacteria bacterium]|nr:UDP-2,3-diacylglucosamine diphosphatase LpxI [Alphaproteobacteria bacterium]